MPDTVRASLRRSLVDRYTLLRERLTRRLGSESLAQDALHETWVTLGEGGALEPVRNPEAYVYRAAINTSINLGMKGGAPVHDPDLAALAADDAPGQDRIAEGRAELALVMQALDELPARQRDVFIASFIGSTPPEVLASRYAVSIRTVQADIRAAVVHCARRLGRKDVLANGRVRLSRK